MSTPPAPRLKLLYFDIPARGEATRLILTYGKVAFEDAKVDRALWPELKKKTPFGQVPVLELEDGRLIAQSGAIERYAAKLAGLYPEDPITAAFADQTAFLLDEIYQTIGPGTFALPEGEPRIKARQELMAGKVKDKLLLLQKQLEHQPYLAGKDLSFVDFTAFAYLGLLKSGFLDGVSPLCLEDYPALKDLFHRIATFESIKARYAHATGLYAAYKA